MLSRRCLAVILLAGCAGMACAGGVSTFDDLTLATESYWDGADGSGGFISGAASFNNSYNSFWGSWDGWAYSNTTDTTTAGYGNQFSAYAGSGANGSANYGVAFVGWGVPPTATLLTDGVAATGAYFTNTTYAALSMRYGDLYAKKFGGATGDDPDWFLLTITGKDGLGNATGTVDFYLADYRFENNALDYIVNDWTWVDLSSLGAVASLEFTLSSSDNGLWGMNTPAYFAMDDLHVAPEPATALFFVTGLAGVAGTVYRRRCRR